MISTIELEAKRVIELKEMAAARNISTSKMNKATIVEAILKYEAEQEAEQKAKPVPLKKHNWTREAIKEKFSSTKAQVYFLLEQDYTRAEIARLLLAHYSQIHAIARNWERGTKESKPTESISGVIRKMYDAGWERAAIAKKLGKEYSFIHNVIKAYERRKQK